ncbi:polysaccharide pyruvyl transferase family protein [Stecheria sp. CLA-KB-P133]|uniref:Polysaccharide pyruvyl transferase family protein n=1 Tax=Grylomicrobium aquisgranensis TaxID=2926318 RepID=A0AB35U5G8_9FIRM|nr:polysaccharide pyruvyl transferase family protein [Stecheria sp. CLA-KB-P133]
MKTVGILTFHKSINYGSVLQCWALKDILEKHGYDVEVLDYEPSVYQSMYGVYSHGKFKHNLNVLPVAHDCKNQIKKFSEFRNKYLNLSDNQYFYDTDFSPLKKYDALVCGSDQIWNLRAQDCEPFYFAPIKTDGRKIAYAISSNDTTYDEPKATNQLRDWILDFDYLSEREEDGAKKLEAFLDHKKRVDVNLDPTLLHRKEDFDAIASPRIEKKPYIFLYNVWSTNDGFEAARRLSKRLNMPVYTGFMARTFKAIVKVTSKGIHVERKYTSPSDYISLIKYADWVVTDSFHGTAFSLIFEKNFISVNSLRDNGNLKNDSRLMNILNEVGLIDRYVPVSGIDLFDINKTIDYKAVTTKRLEMANMSINRLIDAIEGKLNS